MFATWYGTKRDAEHTTKIAKHKEVGTPTGGCFYIDGGCFYIDGGGYLQSQT